MPGNPARTNIGDLMPQTPSSPFLHAALSLLLATIAAAPALAHADDSTRASQPACGTQAADPAAVHPGTLVRALYDIVSGPAKGKKDWIRLQSLHAPGALITPTQHRSTMSFAASPQTVQSFVGLNERLFAARGFYEREVFQRVERFGHIAHVWSGYETREEPGGAVLARGVNSFQLLHDGQRWCVLSATWDTAGDAHPTPATAGSLELME